MLTPSIPTKVFSSESAQFAPIIFTDDQPGFLSFYRMTMRSVHLEAIYTTSTQEVLQICYEPPVSLVITNVRHEGLSGVELLRDLRSHPKTAKLPVLFVTALDTYSLSRQLDAGIKPNGFLRKPVEPEMLLDKIYSLRLQ